MNPVLRAATILAFLNLIPLSLAAQQKKAAPDEMSVDMPDQTMETDVVDLEQWQVETALLYNHFQEKPNAVIGQLLVRYGLTRRIELRVLAEDGRQRDRYMTETVQSNAPLAVGMKFVLVRHHPVLPDITLISSMKLPFTSRSSEQRVYWAPLFLVAFQHQLGKDWKLEYNIGGQQEVYSKEHVWLGNASLHYKVAQPVEIYGEYYSQFKSGDRPQHNLGGGIAWQLGYHMEVYASGGSSIDYDPGNYYLSCGIAFRTH